MEQKLTRNIRKALALAALYYSRFPLTATEICQAMGLKRAGYSMGIIEELLEDGFIEETVTPIAVGQFNARGYWTRKDKPSLVAIEEAERLSHAHGYQLYDAIEDNLRSKTAHPFWWQIEPLPHLDDDLPF